MIKHAYDPSDSPDTDRDDVATASHDTPQSSSEDQARIKRQKIIDRISAQTSVDPSDQLRSDQLAFVPRSYQLELAELAKAGNVLVCLDTGSGKTLISVLLLQHVHKQTIETSLPWPASIASAPKSPKVSFFLVNLVPLVHQQSSVIAAHSNLAVGKLYGELKETVRGTRNRLVVDNWRSPQWSALLESHQVIVSTAQCFLDALVHGFVKMDDLNLLIFDEVHHALKNHPFSRIMKFYRLAPTHQRPKIFGMTASPIFTNKNLFNEASQYLQKTMNARIHTVSKQTLHDLNEVKQKPEESVIEYESYLTVLDDEINGAHMSPLTKEMLSLFGKHPSLDDDAVLDAATESFEKQVRPKLEYTMRHLGPLGCDLFWHSTLLEYRSRARKWVNIHRDQRALVSDDWIMDASMRKSTASPLQSQESLDESEAAGSTSQSTRSGLGLGLAVAHLSTNSELNRRILLHMREQPVLPHILSVDATNSSPKVQLFVQTLKCFEPSADEFCAIVFVERRQTATLLVELIKRTPGLEFIHPEFLLGHDNGSASGGAPGLDWHDQVQVLNRFRRRKPTNLLVATSIAEEGLDIQAANLVIRFDLFNRHISFLQSRGRARAKRSRFIIMAETNNRNHYEVIAKAFNTEASRSKWLQDVAGPDHDAAFWDDEWQHKLRIEMDAAAEIEQCIYEPSTGARLFPEEAPTLISHVAATLHSEYLKDAVLAYRMETHDAGIGCPKSFSCVLELPSTSAVRSVESGVCRNKKQAKRMAAFKACQQLREVGELDEWLMPKLVGETAAGQEQLEVGKINPHHKAWRGSGKPIHVPIKKMDGWARLVAHADAEVEAGPYHATFLALDAFHSTCQPLLLLSRGPLPKTKLLKVLHPISGRHRDLCPKSLGPLKSLSKEDLEAATRFTKFVFKYISRKDDHGSNANSKLQGKHEGEPAVLIMPVRAIPGVNEVQSLADLKYDLPASLELSDLDISKVDTEQLKSRVLVRQNGYHSHSLYKFEAVRHDLSPLSAVDPTRKEASEDNPVPTYLMQHFQRYDRDEYRRRVSTNQACDPLADQLVGTPLLEVTKVSRVRDLLTASVSLQKPTIPSATHLIVPYFYKLHPLSTSLVSSILLLPSILTRYDQLLLAHCCNVDLFSGKLDTDLVLEALTSPSAGSGFDYERLEFLGDTFLKLVATSHTFTTHLGRTEAELHLANKAILTNVRLLKEANRLGLGAYAVLASSKLVVKRFVAPVVGAIGGKFTEITAAGIGRGFAQNSGGDAELGPGDVGEVDTIKEKTLSDLVEALIGAALVSQGTPCALFVCRTLQLIPPTIHDLCDFNHLLLDLKSQSVAESWQARVSLLGLHHLQFVFAHTYRYPHLGLEAFTHPSLLASVLPSYQRLEFLGDAWIDFHIVRRIYARHDQLNPGELTALKGLLASNAALSALGHQLGIHKYIASNSEVLCSTIAAYADGLETILTSQTQEKEKGIHREGEETDQYWTLLPRTLVTPKAIADVVEASFASIVVDCGFDETVSQGLFDRIFAPFYDRHCRYDSVRIGEVKMVVEYLLSILRRELMSGGETCRSVEMHTNLLDLNIDGEEKEGEGEEERLLEALLMEIWVELKVGTQLVGRCVVLAKSAAHLVRAVGLVKEIRQVGQSIARLAVLLATTDDDEEEGIDDEEQHESELVRDEPLEGCSGRPTPETLVALIDEQEHLMLQLARTLGWKQVFQSVTCSDRGERVPFSLAQLRAFVVGEC